MKKQALACTAMLFAFNAHAIVKIDSSINKPEGMSGNVAAEIELDKRDSEVSEREIEWSTQINYRNKNQIFTLIASEEYQKTNNQLRDDSSFYHLRYIQVDALPYFHIEGFFQRQADPFQQLSRRTLLGAGISQYSNPYDLSVGLFTMDYFAGVMAESERSTQSNDIDDDSVRFATKFNAKLDLTKYQSELFFTYYFQPKVDSWSDYRSVLQAGISTTIVANTTLSIAYQSQYDADPFENAYKKRSVLTTSISYHF